MPAHSTATETRLYTVAELAREFRVADATARSRLTDVPAEYVEGSKQKRWRMAVAAPAILKVGNDKLDPAQAIARANIAMAVKREMDNAVTARELIPADLYVETVARGIVAACAALDALPGKLKRGNPALTEIDIRRVKRTIADARNALAARDIDWSRIES